MFSVCSSHQNIFFGNMLTPVLILIPSLPTQTKISTPSQVCKQTKRMSTHTHTHSHTCTGNINSEQYVFQFFVPNLMFLILNTFDILEYAFCLQALPALDHIPQNKSYTMRSTSRQFIHSFKKSMTSSKIPSPTKDPHCQQTNAQDVSMAAPRGNC